MSKTVLMCERLFDGSSDALAGPSEILTEGDVIVEISRSAVNGLRVPRGGSQPGALLPDRRRRHRHGGEGRGTIADIAVTEKVDFVMRAGRVYRHHGFDIFRS